MSDYTQVNDYSAKDALSSGDPSKKILGADIDAELLAISNAIATKADTAADTLTTPTLSAPTLTGAVTVSGDITSSGTNTLSGANTFSGAATFTAYPTIQMTVPWVKYKDTDLAVNAGGLWSIGAFNNTLAILRNTAAGGDFSTYDSILVSDTSGNITGIGYLKGSTGVYDGVNRVWSASNTPVDAITQGMIANSAVGQGELKTASQQTSASLTSGSSADIPFTGGFYTLGWGLARTVAATAGAYSAATYTAGIRVTDTGASNANYYFQANYVQASPPYDLGDGEIPLFVFAVVDSLGRVVAVDTAQDPPWYYNGPNRVSAFKTISGKKVGVRRKVQLTPNGPVVVEVPVLTTLDKNLDMNVIPHPFMGNDLTGKTVVLLDPVSKLVQDLLTIHEVQDPTAHIGDLLMSGKIKIDNTALTRGGPRGLMSVTPRWKLTP